MATDSTELKVHYRDEVIEAWYSDFSHSPEEGFDLLACHDLQLHTGQNGLIDLGIIVKPPYGYRAEIVMRSSTFKRYGIILANQYGVIDPRYSGTDDYLKAHVVALGNPVTVPKGARICQLLLRKICKIEKITKFNPNKKSRGGFGSTGV